MMTLKRPLNRGRAAAAALAVASVSLTTFALAAPAIAADEPVTDGLVAHYALDETSGTTAVNNGGTAGNATYVGGATLQGDAGARLDGVNDYVSLPNNILTGLDSATVSIEVFLGPTQPGTYFILGLGNSIVDASSTGYLGLLANANLRGTISPTHWSNEQSAVRTGALSRGSWHTLTYTLDDDSNTSTLYLNGVQVAQNAATTITPAQIGGGTTTRNGIGRSSYAADGFLNGSVRNFRLYDSALSASDVATLVPGDDTRVARDLAALNLGDTSAVTSNLTLPTTGVNGSTISWASSNDAVVGTTGQVTRPAAGEPNAPVTLTATVAAGGADDTREFEVTVLANSTPQSITDAAAAALVVNNIDDVRGNLTLPTETNGFPVTWATSDGAIVATDGIVNRQAADAQVTLTATVTNGELTAQRQFTAQVQAAVEVEEFEGYAFSYFVNNSVAGEKIYFAASDGNNALDWDELNGGDPILESEFGEKGLRDPFLIRSPEGDKFYMIATDLSIGRNGNWDRAQRQGSQYLEIWESDDLVNWSDQRHVKVAPDNAGNTWAPEAYYDESIGAYVVFWASKLYAASDPGHTGSQYNRMMYATTRDFVTFSEALPWQDAGVSRIDTTVLLEDGTYYRFTKDEGAGTTGCSDIMQEHSTVLLAPVEDWEFTEGCIGRDAGTSAVEGPSIFKANPNDVNGDGFYLFVDEYGGRGYIPLHTDDIANPDWTVAANYDLPSSPRHGTVIPVTADELAGLRELIETAVPVTANEDGEVLRYDFEQNNGTTLTDVTGNGYNGTISGGSTVADGVLAFDGTNDYVQLPNHIMAGVEDITIEAEVYVDSTLSGNYFIYGLGNTDAAGVGNGYLFTSGNATYRTRIATGDWNTEQSVADSKALVRDQWANLTYTLSGDTAKLYLNGVLIDSGSVTINPGDIGGGFTTANRLGDSNYTADGFFKGSFREFAIYNRALSESEVMAASGRSDVLTGVTLGDESALAMDPIVDADAHTVLFPVKRGTDVTALSPEFETADAVTSTPTSGTTVDLSSPVEYTLSGDSDATWTMSAVEVRSPVLEGLYADPNIIAVGDTYYIYATSDGYSSWGGKEFYVWSSKDLVDWERAEEPFLTLDGASGNVPWATGNAWAPTIIERDGKFYFYFSGHNSSVNRKTIGVAVADHPEGPFTAEPQAMILNNEAVTSGQAIDPAAFHDPVSGKYYLYWGNGSPVMAELSDDMVSLKEGSFKTMPGLTNYREGSFMVYRDGIYHLTYSIDDTGSPNYRVGYATSTTPEGPWTYRSVILEKDPSLGILGTGHNSILNVPGTDDWYIVYHRFAMEGGNGTNRETTIDRLTFDPETGFIQKVTPTLSAVDAQEIDVTEPPEPISFTDVNSQSAFFNEISWLAAEGISTGWNTPEGREFRPFDTINRDAMAAFLYRYAGSPDVTVPSTSPFVDVKTTSAYYKQIVWMSQQGISTGWDAPGGKKAFRPYEPITRDAMAAFLYRFADKPSWSAPSSSPFKDLTPSSKFYKEITWLNNTGITTGWSVKDGKEYRPANLTRRDAMAAFLYRFDGL